MTTAAPPSPNGRNRGVDTGRLLAAFSVVAVHVDIAPLRDNIAGFVAWEVLCRWAVPFFFVAAGFYAHRTVSINDTLRHIATRIVPLLIVWNAIYFAVEGPPPVGDLWRIFVTGTAPAFHLWFLPSLAMCTLLLALLRKAVGPSGLLAIGLALYAAGLACGSYAQPLFAHGFGDLWDTRNGPFFGFVFMAIGLLFRERGTPAPAMGVVLFAAGALLQAGEILWLFLAYDLPLGFTDFVLGTLPMGVGGFIVFHGMADWPLWRRLGSVGTLAFGVYAVHLLFLHLLSPLLQPDPGSLAQAHVLLVATFAVSLATVALAARIPALRRFVT